MTTYFIGGILTMENNMNYKEKFRLLSIQEQMDYLFEQVRLLSETNDRLKKHFDQAKEALLVPAFEIDVAKTLKRNVGLLLVELNKSLMEQGLVRTHEEFLETPEGQEKRKELEERDPHGRNK